MNKLFFLIIIFSFVGCLDRTPRKPIPKNMILRGYISEIIESAPVEIVVKHEDGLFHCALTDSTQIFKGEKLIDLYTIKTKQDVLLHCSKIYWEEKRAEVEKILLLDK